MAKLDLTSIQNKKIGLIGAGIETYALAKFLHKNKINFDLLELNPDRVNDFKKITTQIFHGKNYLAKLHEYNLLVRSPGYPLFKLQDEVKDSGGVAEISSAIKLFFKLSPAKIIGVTGTKGKGTTSTLIYEILKNADKDVKLAGNIGSGPFDFIEDLTPDSLVVLELSSFQLEDLDESPFIGVILEISPDHLKPISQKSPNFHSNIQDYVNAKANIVSHQSKNDWAIVNIDHEFSGQIINNIKSNKLFISKNNSADIVIKEEKIIFKNNKEFDFSKRFIKGGHNLYNIAAAVGVSMVLNINSSIIEKTINHFKGLPHRIQFVCKKEGILFYNDSYATGPRATIAAIESFDEDIALILGGSTKGVEFNELAKKIKNSSVKYISLIGQEADNISNALKKVGFNNFEKFGQDFKAAIVSAKNNLNNSGIVLLSPACASTDMFVNAAERGNIFITMVNKDGEVNGTG